MSVPTSPHWHLTEPTLRDYAAGEALPVAGASVEAHLLACADCRARLGGVCTSSEKATACTERVCPRSVCTS